MVSSCFFQPTLNFPLPILMINMLLQVNGDTLFVTSNFKEFRLESSTNGIWDERNAVASTAVCL